MFSKLRHPVRAIREPFGTAGLIVAVVALIAALAGGAYAASGGLTAKQKKEVKKIAKQFAGKPGATGPQGPAGANGTNGAKGDTGAAGTNGTNGTNGVSPVGTAFSGEQNGCKEGGVKFVGANTTAACNGVKGAEGQTGFTETLPSGETETGVWYVSPKLSFVLMSFNIPLPSAPTEVVYVRADGMEEFRENSERKERTPLHCHGSEESPEADPGYVCMYATFETGTEYIGEGSGFPLLKKSGAAVNFNSAAGIAGGTWAVTPPTS